MKHFTDNEAKWPKSVAKHPIRRAKSGRKGLSDRFFLLASHIICNIRFNPHNFCVSLHQQLQIVPITEQIMKLLRDRILKDGKCYPGGILKVDKFINHQLDPNLMKQIAVEFIRRYASSEINKILTIEASGIAPAIMMGFLLDLPVVFAKKKKPSTMGDMLSTTVFSFTKQREYHVVISKDYLTPNDKVLFIDDFLAYGNAAKGIIDLCRQGGAELVGMGFIIEKAFQHGREVIEKEGIRCESLAIIDSLDNCEIKIREE